MSEFKLPPISPIIGSSFANFRKAFDQYKIDKNYYKRYYVTAIIILILAPLRWVEYIFVNPKVKKFHLPQPPLFILGHWRSGTTFLHNVLSQAPNSGYLTTYHSLFPNNLSTRFLIRPFLSSLMPKKRPSDNVELNVRYPQEDEFALSMLNPNAYYYFFMFPQNYPEIYDKSLRQKGMTEKEKTQWKKNYEFLVKKALMNSKAEQIIFKNPVNTARPKLLLELFPDAKFIHIHRNPVMVYLSIKKFFFSLMPTLNFQDITEEEILDLIFDVYQRLMTDFFDQQNAIPSENFIEIRFENLEVNPLAELEKIYQKLNLKDWEGAKPAFEAYLTSQKSYKKNTHKITQVELDRILNEWGFTMKKWGYEVPENLEVVG